MARRLDRFLPRTLFMRSLLIIVMPLILLQIICSWIFYDRHWQIVQKRLAAGTGPDPLRAGTDAWHRRLAGTGTDETSQVWSWRGLA